MFEVSKNDIRVVDSYKKKSSNSYRLTIKPYTKCSKKPSSCYNLTFFSIAKANQFFKTNLSIKSSYKSPTNLKKKLCFSKSPSQYSTMTPNTEHECGSNNKKKHQISNLSFNKFSSKKNSFKRREGIPRNPDPKTKKISNITSVTISESDDIIRADFIPEEMRKKMLIDVHDIHEAIVYNESAKSVITKAKNLKQSNITSKKGSSSGRLLTKATKKITSRPVKTARNASMGSKVVSNEIKTIYCSGRLGKTNSRISQFRK